jgi:hypothetical protein
MDDFEAICMEHWYTTLGTEKLAYPYIRGSLDSEGLRNVTLIEGEVEDKSCDFIDEIHLAWLDMDMINSMRTGFNAVADKIVKGGLLVTHDVKPQGHIKDLYELFFNELIDPKKWVEIPDEGSTFINIWQKL